MERPHVERHDLERRVVQKLAFLLTINLRSSSVGMELMQEPERSEESLR